MWNFSWRLFFSLQKNDTLTGNNSTTLGDGTSCDADMVKVEQVSNAQIDEESHPPAPTSSVIIMPATATGNFDQENNTGKETSAKPKLIPNSPDSAKKNVRYWIWNAELKTFSDRKYTVNGFMPYFKSLIPFLFE